MTRKLELRLFGAFEAAVAGETVTRFEAATARGLLAYVAMRPQHAVPREQLARLLWGLDAGATGLTNLRSSLRRVRAALGDESAAVPILFVERESVRLNPVAELDVDALAFEQLLAATRTHAHILLDECDDCRQRLRAAVGLYRGPFLGELRISSELFQDWQRAQQERLQRMAVQALHLLADLDFRSGDLASAEQLTRRQLELENWNEEAHRQLMRILVAGGQRTAALAQFDLCRQVLAFDLGIEPSPETVALYELLLADSDPTSRLSPANPYKGLAAFGVADASFFFGRRALTRRLVEAINSQPLVMLVGPSGSGKSSVVNAGVVATLAAARALDGQTSGPVAPGFTVRWSVVSFRPGAEPFAALADALGTRLAGLSHQAGGAATPDQLLREGALSLNELASLLLPPAHGEIVPRLLLIADQFEELFTLGRSSEARLAFLDFLLGPLRNPPDSGRCVLLLTMRADFLAQLLLQRGMADALREHILVIGPMSRKEMLRAIEEPARMQGVELEPGLALRLLDEVGEEPGKMPLLQFALTRLWQARTDDGWLTHAAYNGIEGVRGALTQYADGVYAHLTALEQEQARRVLLTLVQPGQDAPDTRRIATRTEVGEEGWVLVQKLADARLVVTDRGSDGNETTELAHEALIREWRRLREWLELDRTFHVWQQQTRIAFEQWSASGEDESGLLRGSRLAEAERWATERSADLPVLLRRYLAASVVLRERRQKAQEEQRQRELEQAQALAKAEHLRAEVESNARRRLRRLAMALAAVSLVALAAAVLGFRAQRNAEENAQLALARQLGAQAINAMDKEVDLALLLSQEALRLGTSPEEQAELLTELEIDPLLVQFLHGPPSALYNVAFADTGQWLMASNELGALVGWDLETGRVRQLPASGSDVRAHAAVSPRGDRMATADGARVTLWDSGTLAPVGHLARHLAPVNFLAFTPGGEHLVTGGEDGQVLLWDAATGAFRQVLLTGNRRAVYGPVTTDGRILLLGNEPDDKASEDTFVLWDAATGAVHGEPLRHTDDLHGYAVSRDGELLATASFDGSIRLWDAQTGTPISAPMRGHTGRVLFVTFSPDGRMVASGGTDNRVRLWAVPSGQPIGLPLIGHNNWARTGVFRADGRVLATGDAAGNVLLWNVGGRHLLAGHTERARSLALSPDAATLVTGGFDRRLVIWDAKSLRQLRTLETEHQNAVIEIAYSHDGTTLASVDAGGGVLLWDVATWTPRFPLYADRKEVLIGLDFSPDDTMLVVGAFDGAFQPWSVATGRPLHVPIPAHTGWALSLRFSPDGRHLVSGGQEGVIRFWDTATWQPAGEPVAAHENWVTELLFAPDGATLVSSSADGTIRFWDVARRASLGMPLESHRAQVWDLHYDGAHQPPRLLSLGGDGAVIWWDWESRLPLAPPLRTSRETERMVVSPDGTRLYLGSFDATALVMDVAELGWDERACRIANRNLTGEEWRQYLHDLPYRPSCLPEAVPGQ